MVEGEDKFHCEGLAHIVNEFVKSDQRYLLQVKNICTSHQELITRNNLAKAAALQTCTGADCIHIKKTIEGILIATKITVLISQLIRTRSTRIASLMLLSQRSVRVMTDSYQCLP